MRFVSGPCSETQPASTSSDKGRGKGARALMEARGRYPVRRAAVPMRATGERRDDRRRMDEAPALTGTPHRLRRLAIDGTKNGRFGHETGRVHVCSPVTLAPPTPS